MALDFTIKRALKLNSLARTTTGVFCDRHHFIAVLHERLSTTSIAVSLIFCHTYPSNTDDSCGETAKNLILRTVKTHSRFIF